MSGADLVEKARQFATAAHRGVGQTRKYTGEPYDEHLRRVAGLVETVTDDPEMIAAAWLHDVVEDTPVTLEEVEREFGPGVRGLVDALTDVSRPHHGNRRARKAMDREHLAQAPARAQTVKLADLVDNCDDICRHNRGFGRIFLAEMGELLAVLDRGDPRLVKRARNTHAKWSQKLPRAVAPPDADSITATEVRARVGQSLDRVANTFRARDIAEPIGPGDAASNPAAAQVVPEEAPLTAVVAALSRHETCYATDREGRITGRIGREHLQGPVGRMWLFGMVTTLEWIVTEDIRAAGDSVDWTALVSPGRLKKAEGLHEARVACGRPVALLDCLQLADKVRIFRAIEKRPMPLLRGASREGSQRLARDLEELRNALAHAQDVVTHDWTQIARLARRLEELAEG
jgi:hypothetical protein